jgi:hypothetical protein
MAKLSGKEIRARLNEKKAQRNGGGFKKTANAVYPFWDIENGDQTTLRLLPDGNKDAENPWAERLMIKLPFKGIKGKPETAGKEIIVSVPCMHMYGEKCPIIDEVKTWYDDETMTETANVYWKKRTYIFQGFVRDDPMNLPVPENPIRRFIMGPQVYQMFEQGLCDEEYYPDDSDQLPSDEKGGRDFIVKKTQKPGSQYADYTGSRLAIRESDLTDEELDAIETHGLSNLEDFFPKMPTPEVQKVIYQMFDASIDGEEYDPEKWATYYRPYGVDNPNYATNTDESAPEVVKKTPAPTPEPEVKEEVAEVEVVEEESAPAGTNSNRAQSLLDKIRSRPDE